VRNVSSLNGGWSHLSGKSLYYRANSTTFEKVPALVNTETGKFMSLASWNIAIKKQDTGK